MILIFMIFMIVASSLQSLFCRLYSIEYPGDSKDSPIVFTAVYGAAIAAFSLAAGGFSFDPSSWTVIFGIINGAILFGYNISLIRSSERGPYSIVSVIMLCACLIIPVVSDALLFDGDITALQILAIALLICGVSLMNSSKFINSEKSKKGFWLFCAVLAFCNGIYSSILSAQDKMAPNDRSELLIITFSVSSVFAIATLFASRGMRAIYCFKQSIKSLVFLTFSCIAAAIAPNMLLYALSKLDTAVVMTFLNGGVIVLSAVYSFVLFKEKITIKKAAGLMLTLASCIIASI